MLNNLMWNYIDLATFLFETVLTYMFYKNFLGKKASMSNYTYFVSSIILFGVVSVVNYFFPDPTITIILCLITRFLYSLLFDGNIKAKSFAAILFTALIIASELLAYFSILAMTKINADMALQQGADKLVGVMISKIILLIITVLFCLNKKPKNKISIPFWYWIGLFTTVVLCLIIMYVNFYSNFSSNSKLTILSYIASISPFCISIIIFYLFKSLIDSFYVQTQYRLLEQQINYQIQHYNDLEISHNEIRSLRHDMKNHLQGVSALVRSGKVIEALDYLESVTKIFKPDSMIITTGNTVLDSLLNAKLMLMKEKKIEFSYKIEIPENIKVKPIDICVILGNSLDNAIEACDRIESGDKKITMVLAYKSSSLVYSLTNSTDGRLVKGKNHYLSSKKNYKEYGFGLSNITNIVDQYNGTLKIDLINNNFELSTVLYDV